MLSGAVSRAAAGDVELRELLEPDLVDAEPVPGRRLEPDTRSALCSSVHYA